MTLTVKEKYEDLFMRSLAQHKASCRLRKCECGEARGESHIPFGIWHRRHVAQVLAANAVAYVEAIFSEKGAS